MGRAIADVPRPPRKWRAARAIPAHTAIRSRAPKAARNGCCTKGTATKQRGNATAHRDATAHWEAAVHCDPVQRRDLSPARAPRRWAKTLMRQRGPAKRRLMIHLSTWPIFLSTGFRSQFFHRAKSMDLVWGERRESIFTTIPHTGTSAEEIPDRATLHRVRFKIHLLTES